MKKLMISASLIFAILFFVSCGGNSSDKEKDSEWGDQGDSTADTGDTDADTGDTTAADTGDTASDTGDTEASDTGDATADTGDTDADTGDTGDTDATDTDADTDGGEEDGINSKFLGRWAAEIIFHSKSSTSLAKNVPSITTRFVLVDFYINEKGQLDMKKVDDRLCRIDNRTGDNAANKGNVRFNEPYKFNTVFYHWKPADLPGQEEVPYVEVADNGGEISFKLNKDFELRGAKMDDPSTEAMPTKDSDSRIFDHDEDGKAAFTIGFNGFVSGDILYVQRLSHIFTGKLVADGKIEGNVEWTDEQYAHQDTSNITLKGQKTTVTYTEKSIFQFVKVADDMACDAMLEQADAGTLFDLVDPNAGDATGK